MSWMPILAVAGLAGVARAFYHARARHGRQLVTLPDECPTCKDVSIGLHARCNCGATSQHLWPPHVTTLGRRWHREHRRKTNSGR
jgi:hypothetical protein